MCAFPLAISCKNWPFMVTLFYPKTKRNSFYRYMRKLRKKSLGGTLWIFTMKLSIATFFGTFFGTWNGAGRVFIPSLMTRRCASKPLYFFVVAACCVYSTCTTKREGKAFNGSAASSPLWAKSVSSPVDIVGFRIFALKDMHTAASHHPWSNIGFWWVLTDCEFAQV